MTVPAIQLHNGSSDWDGRFHDRTCARAHHLKIPGAFYTSSERPDGRSAWTDWARTDMPHLVRDTLFRYEVMGSPKALVLRTDDDLISAYKQLGLVPGEAMIDEPSLLMMEMLFKNEFRRLVVEHYDCIHIPDDFDRFSSAGLAYDCETTAWFRPGPFLMLIEKATSTVSSASEPEAEIRIS
jgi:hypothetical protein